MNDCSSSNPVPAISSQDLEPAAFIFKALGHPIRLMIVYMLLDGERCVCELHQNSGRDMSTISSHLTMLKNAGIITSEQRGKNVYYTLKSPAVRYMLSCVNIKPSIERQGA